MTNFPGKFLGTPLFQGVNKKQYWQRLVSRYANKMSDWKGKRLSPTRKLLMIK